MILVSFLVLLIFSTEKWSFSFNFKVLVLEKKAILQQIGPIDLAKLIMLFLSEMLYHIKVNQKFQNK